MKTKMKGVSAQAKIFYIIVLAFIARIATFFALPNTPSSLAPDEGTYGSLAKWISESKPATDFPGSGEGLYLSGRSVIIPASTLIKLGMNELDAVRLTSSIYGLLSLCVVALLSSKLLHADVGGIKGSRKLERLVVSLILVYAFLPSHFVWSNLGLRESPNEFWLIVTFVGVFLLYRERQSRKLLIASLIFISIVCTFSSRPQVGWVLVVTLLIYSLLKMKNKLTYLLITSVLTGLFAGYQITTPLAYVTTDVYIAKDSTSTPTKDSTPMNRSEVEASKLCDGALMEVEYKGRTYNCIKSGTVTKRKSRSNFAEVVVDQVEFLPGKQNVNQVGAASMIERLACPWEESSEFGKYGCLAFRAPYMTLTFLFRPLLFVDITSSSSMIAAAENVLWTFLFIFILFRIYKSRQINFFRELSPSLIFFSLYVVGAGSYEGNMGTAFRHKSLILWVLLLLLLATSGLITKKEDLKERNTS